MAIGEVVHRGCIAGGSNHTQGWQTTCSFSVGQGSVESGYQSFLELPIQSVAGVACSPAGEALHPWGLLSCSQPIVTSVSTSIFVSSI